MDESKLPPILMQDRSLKMEFLEQVQAAEDPFSHTTELAALAQDEDPDVRVRALECFWELGDPRYIDLLLELARTDPVEKVRTAATTSLGRYIYEGFVLEEIDEEDYEFVKQALVEIYDNPAEPPALRRTALESLGFITDDDIETLTRIAYETGDLEMRISALFAMGRSGTRAWDDIIHKEMKNPDVRMRFEAVRAAGETFMSQAAEILEKLTEDPERDIRLAAIEALGKAGRLQSHDVLRRLSGSPDEDIRDAAAAALDELDMFESEAFADES